LYSFLNIIIITQKNGMVTIGVETFGSNVAKSMHVCSKQLTMEYDFYRYILWDSII